MNGAARPGKLNQRQECIGKHGEDLPANPQLEVGSVQRG